MNPKPFWELNHFTVPVATVALSQLSVLDPPRETRTEPSLFQMWHGRVRTQFVRGTRCHEFEVDDVNLLLMTVADKICRCWFSRGVLCTCFKCEERDRLDLNTALDPR